MEIFHQLLESYTLIKKRKFRVLREAQEGGMDPRVAIASQVIAANVAGIPQQMQQFEVPNKSPTAANPTVKVEVYTQGGINVGGRHAKWDGQLLSVSKNPEDFQEILTMLAGKGEGEAPQQTQKTAPVSTAKLPGQHIAAKYSELEEAFIKLDRVARKLHPKILESDEFKKFAERDPETSEKLRDEDYFASFFGGAKSQGLESKIANAIGITFDETGLVSLLGDEDPLVRQTVIDTVKSLERAFDLLEKEEPLTVGEKAELKNLLFLAKDKIAIRAEGQDTNKGLTVGDGKGVLGLVMRAMTPEDFVFNEYKKGTDDSAFRGLNLEEVLIPLSLHANCKRKKEAGFDNDDEITSDYCDQAINAWGEFKDQLEKMMKVHEKWLPHFRNGELATLSTDDEMFDQLSQFLGPKFEGLMKGLLSVSNDSIGIRQPDFIVRVGEKTGIALKDDTNEIWLEDKNGGCSKAEEGMKRQGLEGFEATRMDAREAFKSSPSQFSIAQKMQPSLSEKGSTVCVAGVSIKNYLSLAKKNPKFGENFLGRIGRLFDCIGSGECDPKDKNDRKMLTKFLTKLPEQMGQDPATFYKEVTGYESKNRAISESVDGLSFNHDAIDPETGKITNTNSVETSVKAIIDGIKKNNKLEDTLDTDTLVGATVTKLQELDLKDPKNMDKAKQAIMSHLVNAKRAKDLEQEQSKGIVGPATKHMLASAWAIGASNNDYALFDTRGLTEGTTHTAYQNDYLKEMIAGVKSGKWGISTKGATVTMFDKSNPKRAAKMSNQNRSRGAGGLDSVQAEFSITNGYLQSEKPTKGTENNSVQSFLDTQKVLLEDLLSSMK